MMQVHANTMVVIILQNTISDQQVVLLDQFYLIAGKINNT